MIRFIVRRLAAAVVLLLVLSAIIFVLQAITPGDPVRTYVGPNASTGTVDRVRAELGLDRPWPVRYVLFVGALLRGDLGVSLRTHRPVTTDLAQFLPATVELVLAAFALALVLGALFAVSSALRWPGSALYRGPLLVLSTAPPFLLAIGAIVLFYAVLGWLPASGRGPDDPGPTGLLLVDEAVHLDPAGFGSAAAHLLLPALILAIAPAVAIGRVLRARLEGVLQTDQVRTARSKGLTEGAVVRRHVARNAIGPALSMAGLQLGFMFAGVVVVEQVFSWPGIGSYLARSIPVSDFPAIAGVTLVLGAIYVASNALVDVLQAAADPRLGL
jgi:peptide/nickel transport system permease protein